jgi:hypothetical protein
MIVAIIRILLLTLPAILLIYWLCLRFKKARADADENGNARDFNDIGAIRKVLIITLGAVVLLAATLYFTEDDRGDPGQYYVPARVEAGKIIPGYFTDDPDATPTGDESSTDTQKGINSRQSETGQLKSDQSKSGRSKSGNGSKE